MIKQVQSSSYSSVFTPLQSNSVTSYALTKPIAQNQQADSKVQEEKKEHHLGVIIATAGVSVGVGLLLLSQIFSKKSNLKIHKFSKKLEETTTQMKNEKNLNLVQRGYHNLLIATKVVIKHSKALFTIATLKDIPFKKAFMKIPVLNKIGEGITHFFEKLSVKTSNISYIKTHARLDKMAARMRYVNAKLLKDKVDKANQIEKLLAAIEQDYLHGFKESARNKRRGIAEKNMSTLYDDVWEQTYRHPLQFLRNPETYKEFLAEQTAEKAKKAFNKTIIANKAKISISIKNKITETKYLLRKLDNYTSATDANAVELMKKLKAHIKELDETNWNEHSKDFLKSDFAQHLSELGQHIKISGKYDSKTVDKAIETIGGLRSVFKDNKQGKIQDIMDIYRTTLSEKDYQRLTKTVNKTLSSLDKSTDLEGDKLFDKIRDLKLGSAIHDTLGFLGSIAAVSWYVGKADNKDERISAALKYGIPAVSSVIITAMCTFGLIASGPSLAIGLGSGLVINRVGKFVDNKLKEYQKNKPTLKETAQKIEKKFTS